MDDDCALDSLTAFLDDSDMEDEKEKETPGKEENNEECDIDEIAAFLEESDDENEMEGETPLKASKEESDINDDENKDTVNTCNAQEDTADNEDESQQKSTDDVNDIQAELLEMQRKMQELQKRLAMSQQSEPKEKKVSPKMRKPSDESQKKVSPKGRQPSDESQKEKSCHKSSLSMSTSKFVKESQQEKSSVQSTLSKSKSMKENKEKSSTGTSKWLNKNCELSQKSSLSTMTNSTENTSQNLSKDGIKLLESEENPFFPAKQDKSPGGDGKQNGSPTGDRKALERDLFGEDDNEWEPMYEEDKVKLSEEGNELRKLITDNTKSRLSHATPEQVEELRKKAQKAQWKPKGIPRNSQESTKAKENDAPSVTDPFSGIRIINPKISSMDMKDRMRDRKLIKISKIDKRVSENDNWVTIGVIVRKTEPRQSTTGKTYCIWKLSDLQDCDVTVSFFLFGDVYKQHWKNEVTAVVGILNPNLMDKAEKVQNDTAITVSHPAQIMIMGYSKDYGICAAMTGKGNNMGKHCTNFINKQQGEFCTYHVQRAYSKKCSQRTELQGSYSGVTPKNHKYKPKEKKDSFFFYQGQTFTTGKMPGNKNNQNKVTVDKLKQQQAMVGKGKVTTMSLHSIDPKDMQLLQKLEKPNPEQNSLIDMLTVPTPGSMNFVKHLMSNDKKQTVTTPNGKHVIQSITAAELLKQHKQEIKQRKMGVPKVTDPLKATPTLGKGFAPGKEICFDVSSPKASLSKMQALAKIQAKGGLAKNNPNAVKKTLSTKDQQNIKKRIHENVEGHDENSVTSEPPKKRSKLLGNLDENSDEFKRLMKTSSKHKGVLAEIETEVEEKYFMEQEKKERLEDKMAATMEMKVTVFTCKQCKYTAQKLKDECKQQNHPTVKVQATKRFFKCKKCKNRTTSIDKLPTHPCKNCGENNFERVSMLQERKGSKLPHETLCIRGDEIKFLGSMNEKVFL